MLSNFQLWLFIDKFAFFNTMTAKEFERISKALGDPHRLKILQEIKKNKCMACACIREMIDLAQPSVSHHLKQLIDAGLVIPEKEGREMRYSIDDKVFTDYINYLSAFSQ